MKKPFPPAAKKANPFAKPADKAAGKPAAKKAAPFAGAMPFGKPAAKKAPMAGGKTKPFKGA